MLFSPSFLYIFNCKQFMVPDESLSPHARILSAARAALLHGVDISILTVSPGGGWGCVHLTSLHQPHLAAAPSSFLVKHLQSLVEHLGNAQDKVEAGRWWRHRPAADDAVHLLHMLHCSLFKNARIVDGAFTSSADILTAVQDFVHVMQSSDPPEQSVRVLSLMQDLLRLTGNSVSTSLTMMGDRTRYDWPSHEMQRGMRYLLDTQLASLSSDAPARVALGHLHTRLQLTSVQLRSKHESMLLEEAAEQELRDEAVRNKHPDRVWADEKLDEATRAQLVLETGRRLLPTVVKSRDNWKKVVLGVLYNNRDLLDLARARYEFLMDGHYPNLSFEEEACIRMLSRADLIDYHKWAETEVQWKGNKPFSCAFTVGGGFARLPAKRGEAAVQLLIKANRVRTSPRVDLYRANSRLLTFATDKFFGWRPNSEAECFIYALEAALCQPANELGIGNYAPFVVKNCHSNDTATMLFKHLNAVLINSPNRNIASSISLVSVDGDSSPAAILSRTSGVYIMHAWSLNGEFIEMVNEGLVPVGCSEFVHNMLPHYITYNAGAGFLYIGSDNRGNQTLFVDANDDKGDFVRALALPPGDDDKRASGIWLATPELLRACCLSSCNTYVRQVCCKRTARHASAHPLNYAFPDLMRVQAAPVSAAFFLDAGLKEVLRVMCSVYLYAGSLVTPCPINHACI